MAEGVAKLPSNRAAIYARVSTEDKGQTPDNELEFARPSRARRLG
jgi:hypothetical protein